MIAVPGAMPFTTPLAETVAIPGVDVLHTPPGVASAKVVVEPAHTASVPVIGATPQLSPKI